ncbi:hypothetical protein YB2330_000557 [Saitoella coloradoensis]
MAHTEVSTNPSSTGVTRATNPKQRDADVDQKLRLYGVMNAFTNGKVPTNKQIDVAMNSFINSDMMRNPSKDLSSEGRHLVQDLRDVAEQAKMLLLTKNYDENLQKFLWHTRVASPDSQNVNAPVSAGQAKEHGKATLDGIRTLGRLMITNGEFRKLLSDAVVLLRDMGADAASKAAEKARPDQERLDRIDEPAPENQWHDTPDVGGMKENLKSKARDVKETAKSDAQAAKNNAASSANPDGSTSFNRTAEHANAEARTGESRGVDAAGGAQAGADTLKERHPEAHRKAMETKDKTVDYLKDKVPEERRQQVIDRLKKMVVEIQQHEDYQEAIDTLLSIAENYKGVTKDVKNQAHGAAKQTADDDHVQLAKDELKTVIERFANSTSLDDVFDSFNELYLDADRDPQMKNWWKRLDRYIRRCLKETGYITSESADREYREIKEEGDYLRKDKYSEHFDRVGTEISDFGKQFAEDPDNKRFGEAVKHLMEDLGTDRNGKFTLKKHLIKDITNVIIPGAFRRTRYVPVPRIEYSDPMVDAVIENLVLESENLFPNILEVKADNYIRYSARKAINNVNHHRVTVHMEQIQMDLRDVAYYIKKKSGFPSVRDTGIIDIFLGGEGLSATVTLADATALDRTSFFKVERVDVKINNLKLKLKKSNHKLLFNLFKPLLMGIIKPVIQKVAEKKIAEQFDTLDHLLYSVYKETKREQNTYTDDEATPNTTKLYLQTLMKRVSANSKEKKDKAAETAQDKHAAVTVSRSGGMFKNVVLPSGFSNRAEEYKRMGQEGRDWTSPVFDLGSAKPTDRIPEPKKIIRRSDYGRATLNDGGNTNNSSSQGQYQQGYNTGYNQSAVSGAYEITPGHVNHATTTTAPATTVNSHQYVSNTTSEFVLAEPIRTGVPY